MFNKSSFYALNKKEPNAIVYKSATGEIIRVTRTDFESKEAFLAFKAWSDENYHLQDNGDVTEDKHTTPMDEISDAALATFSADEEMAKRDECNERRCLVIKLKGKMTETQFRRIWLHEVEGKTLEEIAAMDGVAIQSVHESIERVKNKFGRKNFKKF